MTGRRPVPPDHPGRVAPHLMLSTSTLGPIKAEGIARRAADTKAAARLGAYLQRRRWSAPTPRAERAAQRGLPARCGADPDELCHAARRAAQGGMPQARRLPARPGEEGLRHRGGRPPGASPPAPGGRVDRDSAGKEGRGDGAVARRWTSCPSLAGGKTSARASGQRSAATSARPTGTSCWGAWRGRSSSGSSSETTVGNAVARPRSKVHNEAAPRATERRSPRAPSCGSIATRHGQAFDIALAALHRSPRMIHLTLEDHRPS